MKTGVLWTMTMIILLASCGPIPTPPPTQGPEMAGLLAAATQTAVSSTRQSVSIQQTATQQSIYAQQTAVASYATATKEAEYLQATAAAFNVTATAAMTATWQAEETAVHRPISVQQTSDAHDILSTREALNTMATATAVKRRIDKDEAAATRNEYLGYVFVGFVATCLGSISLYVFGKAWRAMRPNGAVYDDFGNVVAMDKTHYIEVRQARPRHYLPEPTQPEPQQPAPPISNMSPTRPVTIKKNGTSTTIPVNDKNGVRHETWRRLAIALLVYQCNFSRDGDEGVLEQTKHPAWAYGAMSQPEYNKAHQFLSNENMIEGRGEAQELNATGYDYLSKFIPNDLEINLPHPQQSTSVMEER